MEDVKTTTMDQAMNAIKAMKGKEPRAIIVAENEIKVIELPEYGTTTLHSQAGRVVRKETTTSEKI